MCKWYTGIVKFTVLIKEEKCVLWPVNHQWLTFKSNFQIRNYSMNGISEIKTYILTKFWLAVFTVTYGMFSFLIQYKLYSLRDTQLIENQIWKYFPEAVNVQVILAPCWLLKPVSEFVQISLVISPSITRQTFLYRSPQQSIRFRIVSEMNSIGFWSLYFQNLVKYRYFHSLLSIGEIFWSGSMISRRWKILVEFSKTYIEFKFDDFQISWVLSWLPKCIIIGIKH